MSYVAINSTEVLPGKPVKTDLMVKIQGDFSDHESRIAVLETALNSYRPLEFVVQGEYWRYGGAQTEVMIDRLNFNLTLTAARLMIKTAGTSGTTGVDILYKRGAGAWTSIFSTTPSVLYSIGDYGISTNAVISTTALLAGDLLRLDIVSVQTLGNGFDVQLEYVKT